MFASEYLSPARPTGFLSKRHSRTNGFALGLSLALTLGLFALLLSISAARSVPDEPSETLLLLTAHQIRAQPTEPPEEENVDQPEVMADSEEESAPQSRPRTIAPAPAVPVIPPVAIDLTSIDLPAIPQTADGRIITRSATGKGDQARGPEGVGGAGGNGIAGNGSGGAGNGKGDGSRLIASWAPDMDFSRNRRVYPPAARRARIEGVAFLNCFVLRNDRVRDCRLVAETPAGHGFGAAALKTQRWMRIRVHNQAGRRVYDEWVIVKSTFDLPDDPAPEPAEDRPPDETTPVS